MCMHKINKPSTWARLAAFLLKVVGCLKIDNFKVVKVKSQEMIEMINTQIETLIIK